MNEFIVWDLKSESFRQIIKIDFINMYFQLESMSSDDYKVNLNDLTTHTFIGKTDTQGNKIYADSSIVEFEHKNHSSYNTFKLKGVFKFNMKELRYFIECFTGHKISYDSKQKFKIIDTLQENKLGLFGAQDET